MTPTKARPDGRSIRSGSLLILALLVVTTAGIATSGAATDTGITATDADADSGFTALGADADSGITTTDADPEIETTALGAVTADGIPVGPGTVFDASEDGPTVEITEELELDSPFEYPDEHTVDLSPYATFQSDADTNVTADALDGPWTELTTHDVAAGLTIDPAEANAMTIESAAVQTVAFRAVDVGDDDPELSYEAEEPLTVTVSDLPANDEIEVIDVDDGTVIASATTGGNGVGTFALPAANARSVTFQDVSTAPSPSPASISIQHVEHEPEMPAAGGTVDVAVTVENTGEQSGSTAIELRIDDETRATVDDVTVAGGSTETVTMDAVDLADLDAGTYDYSVHTDDDRFDGSLTLVDEKPSLVVTVVDSVDEPVVGAAVEVDGTLPATNTDGVVVFEAIEDGTYSVVVTADGFEVAEESVTIDGESTSITVVLSTEPADDDQPSDDEDSSDSVGAGDVESPDDGGLLGGLSSGVLIALVLVGLLVVALVVAAIAVGTGDGIDRRR